MAALVDPADAETVLQAVPATAVETKQRRSLADFFEQDAKDADEAAEAARRSVIEQVDLQLDALDAAAAAKLPGAPKAANVTSKFSELHAKLSNAAAISEYLRANIAPLAKSPKDLHTFLQAIANRSTAVYEQLFHVYRAETLWVLDRIAAGGTSTSHAAGAGKQKQRPNPSKAKKNAAVKSNRPAGNIDTPNSDFASPYALEFVLRAEAGAPGQEPDYEGDDKKIVPISDHAPLPVLTAREMIADIFVRDPCSYFERQLQLVQSPAEVTEAASRLLALARSSARKAVLAVNDAFVLFEPTETTSAPLITSQKATIQLGHLLSKIRKLLPTSTPAAAASSSAAGITDADATVREELPPITITPSEESRSMVSSVLKLGHKLCTGTNPIEVPAKMQHFIDYAMSNDLVGEDEVTWVEELLAAVTGGAELQADSMTAVLSIKVANTRAELRQAVEAVSDVAANPDSPTLAKPSPDVLSALGTAGVTLRTALKESPSADGEVLCKQILALLVNCTTIPLPRRAAKFVDDEKRLERQADEKRSRIAEADMQAPSRPQPRRAVVGFAE